MLSDKQVDRHEHKFAFDVLPSSTIRSADIDSNVRAPSVTFSSNPPSEIVPVYYVLMIIIIIISKMKFCQNGSYTFFFKAARFSSEPGVANEILENEPKSCLVVA